MNKEARNPKILQKIRGTVREDRRKRWRKGRHEPVASRESRGAMVTSSLLKNNSA